MILTRLVYDWNGFQLSLHRESFIGDPTAAPFSHTSHHRDPRANNITQPSGPMFDDNSTWLQIPGLD